MTIQRTFGIGFDGLTQEQKLQRTARELEAVLIAQLLGAMRKTVPEGGLFGQTASAKLFRTLLDTELARDVADKSPFGLADAVTGSLAEEVKKTQEKAEAQGEKSLLQRTGRWRRIA